MEAGVYNLNIRQGSLFIRRCLWQPGGLNQDPSGWTAKLTIRQPGSSEPFLILEAPDVNGNGLTLGDPNFTVTITIKSALTATFDFDAARYDLDLFDPSGEKYPFLTGQVYPTASQDQ